MKSDRCPTGIPELDESLEGGFPRGSLILVAGNPGAGKTTLGATFLYNGAMKFEEPGVYLSFVEDKKSFYNNMRKLGMDFEKLEEKKLFKFIGVPYTGDPLSMQRVIEKLLSVIKEMNAKRVVVDSITALVHTTPSHSQVRSLLHNVFVYGIRSMGDVTTMLIADLPFNAETIGLGVEEFLVDGVMVLKTRRFMGIVIRWIEIWKMRNTRLGWTHIPFTIDVGGIKPLLPGYTPLLRLPLEANISLRTGISSLDKVIACIRPGSVIGILGRPDSGLHYVTTLITLALAKEYGDALYITFGEPIDFVLERIELIAKRFPELYQSKSRVKAIAMLPLVHDLMQSLGEVFKEFGERQTGIITLDNYSLIETIESQELHATLWSILSMISRRLGAILIIGAISFNDTEYPRLISVADILLKVKRGEKPNKLYVELVKHRYSVPSEHIGVLEL